ncbi:Ubiquitin [Cordyceps fumosorosea ARSEF 2679]|uniref:Ubiquitin-like modifier HUB1 n=1 Tax=Cordyceps fumosorosea (strain ARSEF 2679) TaxID=1081104 RepID=A0A162N1B8_CORFA|nr:Ubiquitin [Cordyceps fumosorosea ARSEF 2679]OAA73899.1 Ubiquitin [Cordyceps fumosorosea ARSEF 2679]
MADHSRPRSRSRSPRRAPKGSGGFRWKEKKSGDARDDRQDGRRDDRRDDRRSDRQDYRNGRDRDFRDQDRNREYRDRDRERSPRRDRSRRRDEARRRSPDDKVTKEKRSDDSKKEKKSKKVASLAGKELIVVHINDRLGTKTAVPCLPDDTIGQLKLMIAARIGREPGQIMLRRQGERPFKDPISLADYGISNGVQLDLEIDTGD